MTEALPPAVRLKHRPLPPGRVFALGMAKSVAFGISFIGLSLWIGALGYHKLAGLNWIDAFLNASMILTGMGPVDHLETDAAKVFATVYALYSGVAFLTFIALMFGPALHRFLHKFHLSIADIDDREAPSREP